jgi:hypothetical protein
MYKDGSSKDGLSKDGALAALSGFGAAGVAASVEALLLRI